MYHNLDEENVVINEWNQALVSKSILLSPPIAFALSFFKINIDKSKKDITRFLTMRDLKVSGGIF